MHWSLSFGGPYRCFWLLDISSGFYLVVRIPVFCFLDVNLHVGSFFFSSRWFPSGKFGSSGFFLIVVLVTLFTRC